jgi:hypothetical protein
VSRLSRKGGSLDVSQAYGPPQPVTGIALPSPYHVERTNIYNGYEKNALIKRDILSQNPQDDYTSHKVPSSKSARIIAKVMLICSRVAFPKLLKRFRLNLVVWD